jgi:hypothetical protein
MIQKYILVTDCRINRGEWSTGNFKLVFNETRGASDAFNFMCMHFPLKRTGIYTYTPNVTLKILRFLYTLFRVIRTARLLSHGPRSFWRRPNH